MKKLIDKLAGTAYRRVFNREMSAAEGDFLQSLSWVGAGTLVASALTALFSILGGRLLGPEEYGRFTLVQSIAMFLYIPMLMGYARAMLKYNAENDDLARRKSITSTAHIIIAGLTAASVSLMLLFSQGLAGLFATTPEPFRLGIYLGISSAFFTVAQTTLRSIDRMRAFALSQPLQAAILLVAFGLFALLGGLTSESMVYSALIAFAVTGLAIYFLHVRRYLTFSFDTAWARTLSRFALAAVAAIIAAAVCTRIGIIIVARYMTQADVGIYGAYLMATMSVAAILWSVFNMVFFPTASRYRDKRPLSRRIDRLVPLMIVAGIPLVMGVGRIVLLLYGGEYLFNLLWLALSATSAILFIIMAFYASLLTSGGPSGAFHSSAAAVVTAGVMVALSLLLVPAIGIPGAIVATIIAYVAGTLTLLWRRRRYLIGAD